ncbi:protein IDA-LIKE 2 [Carica papaya]|uniref:protein IDA-LIKE 2 n=1 Tax=Carica papaya TaxID=3649 RepID=UPI000B8CF8C7|nr:protein IDA-LIKE 2 [Carica papaya]
MAICRRPLLLPLLLFILLIFIFLLGHCHGSRTLNTSVFKVKPAHNTGHFLGFLPRHFPIPTSGPSRKHNDIGLQSWRSSP